MEQDRIHIKLARRTPEERQADETRRLDPFMRALKAIHTAATPETMNVEDLEKQLKGQELLGLWVAPMAGMSWEPFELDGMNCAWVRPHRGHDRRRAILYCHGGGYTSGNLGYSRILASKLANVTGWQVLSFEYRLAPEHPYPAAVEDAVKAWDYLMYQGYGARDVVVAGDSAGGNLALVLTHQLRAAKRRLPRALILLSPWTDMTASGKSYKSCKALDPMLTYEYIEAVRAAYTGPDADWAKPCYSPLFADLRGLPPTLIQVGTNEILRSDSERLAEAIHRAGGYAVLEVYAECWHVFQQMPIHRAVAAMESAGRFVQRMM